MSVNFFEDQENDILKFCKELSELRAESLNCRILQFKAKILELSFTHSQVAEKGIPSALFHYTTTSGMNGILNESHHPSVRVSSVQHLNDTKELKFGLEVLNKVLGQKEDGLDFSTYLESISNDINVGCISFSEHADDVLMWMCYAERGSGVSLGFKTKKLLYARDFCLTCVIYDKVQQIEFMRNFMLELKNFITDFENLKKGEIRIDDNIRWAILTALLSVKAENWRFESEWRLVRWGTIDITEFDKGDFWRRQKFDLSPDTYATPQANDVLSAKIRDFYDWNNDKVSTIIVGPKIFTKKSEIENWAKSNGSKGVEVRESKAPLR